MKLWHLKNKSTSGLWDPWYDKAFGFVIRAETEQFARAIAADECGDEGKAAWMSPEHSTCVELHEAGDFGVIVRDFAAA